MTAVARPRKPRRLVIPTMPLEEREVRSCWRDWVLVVIGTALDQQLGRAATPAEVAEHVRPVLEEARVPQQGALDGPATLRLLRSTLRMASEIAGRRPVWVGEATEKGSKR